MDEALYVVGDIDFGDQEYSGYQWEFGCVSMIHNIDIISVSSLSLEVILVDFF